MQQKSTSSYIVIYVSCQKPSNLIYLAQNQYQLNHNIEEKSAILKRDHMLSFYEMEKFLPKFSQRHAQLPWDRPKYYPKILPIEKELKKLFMTYLISEYNHPTYLNQMICWKREIFPRYVIMFTFLRILNMDIW